MWHISVAKENISIVDDAAHQALRHSSYIKLFTEETDACTNNDWASILNEWNGDSAPGARFLTVIVKGGRLLRILRHTHSSKT